MHVAMLAHGSDRNKHDGELYLLHVHRTAMLVKQANGSPEHVAVAWLHDVLEDTAVTELELFGLFPPEIVHGVIGMTKRKGETNENYYLRCRSNDISGFVKLRGDMVDNFRRNHQIADEATRARMAKKYSLGFAILTGGAVTGN